MPKYDRGGHKWYECWAKMSVTTRMLARLVAPDSARDRTRDDAKGAVRISLGVALGIANTQSSRRITVQ